MKITIERATLLSALGHVQNVVERRNTIPILSNVLLVANGSDLSLTATDLDLTIIETVGADVSQGGATTTAAHTLHDIVRKLPDGAQIELTLSDQSRLAVVAGRSSFALPCLPKEDFPVLAEDTLPHSFSIAADELKRLIDKSRFAISTEETRYYLNGIYLHAAEAAGVPMLRAVATDGHRLAQVDCPLPDGAASMPGVIVPRKAVIEVRRLLDQVDGSVQVSLSETKIRFAFGKSVLTTKLIDGTFPDYQRVIPSGNDKILEVDRRQFAEAVDRVSTISTEKSRSIKLTLEKDKLHLSANSPDSGSADEELVVNYPGEDIEVGFNSRYLLDIASQINGDSARLDLADAVSPTILRDVADERALYVLMPMRV
ncbi:MAG: DNA polymerase III subunit beta [Proteobacteria bacterium]|nr:DNA polymerase III subunit beta [Pseudomonadota bacterium]MDA1058099.1 DNA polymerase III subunit beta [Pseudomonadota bacterium]